MAFLFLILLWSPVALLPSLGWAGAPGVEPIDGATAITEANRLLEEELKLAARPHIYMMLDLVGRALAIKSRGMELQRFPIAEWRRMSDGSLSGVFRLRARPPVTRPKAAPVERAIVTAIELQDMPDRYDLEFDPGLIISVGPSLRERPWPWLKQFAQEWWRRVAGLLDIPADADGPTAVRVHLILAQDTAQSLAWSMTDGMPLIIGRTTLP